MDLSPVVYLLVENKGREMMSRLLIAAALAKRGITSVVGQQWLVLRNLKHLPKGVVVFKGTNRIQSLNMDLALDQGHVPVAIDEECLALKAREQVDLEAFPYARPRRVYVANESLAEMFGDIYHPSAVLASGNPRLDLLAHKDLFEGEASVLRKKHGPFVLFCSNTAGVNTAWGSQQRYLQVLGEVGWAKGEGGPQRYLDHITHDARNVRAMREVLDRLDDVNIVFRPHPAENAQKWVDLYKDRPNITVTNEGSHLAWILASDLLVHTGCTTGLEAYLMGHPSIALRTGHPWEERFISNDIHPVDVSRAVDEIRATFGTQFRHHGARIGDKAHDRIAQDLSEFVKPGEIDIDLPTKIIPLNDYQVSKVSTSPQELGEMCDLLKSRFEWPELNIRQLGGTVYQVRAA